MEEKEEKTTELITVKNFRKFIASMQEANPDYRYGQALFNSARILYPAIVDKVKGTSSDPFFADSKTDERVIKFWFHLFENDFFV